MSPTPTHQTKHREKQTEKIETKENTITFRKLSLTEAKRSGCHRESIDLVIEGCLWAQPSSGAVHPLRGSRRPLAGIGGEYVCETGVGGGRGSEVKRLAEEGRGELKMQKGNGGERLGRLFSGDRAVAGGGGGGGGGW